MADSTNATTIPARASNPGSKHAIIHFAIRMRSHRCDAMVRRQGAQGKEDGKIVKLLSEMNSTV